ncbi:MAG: Csu type fimbrial protein [Ramlibacter sp.]
MENSSVSPFARLGAILLLCGAAPLAAAGCSVSAGSMDFGGYDVFDPQPRNSMLALTVSCQDAATRDLLVSIGPSANSGGIVVRQMRRTGGADRLAYNLFSDPSHSSVWGDGTSAHPVHLQGVTRNSPQQLVVYGQIAAGQDVGIGTYSDAITVTVDIIR